MCHQQQESRQFPCDTDLRFLVAGAFDVITANFRRSLPEPQQRRFTDDDPAVCGGHICCAGS